MSQEVTFKISEFLERVLSLTKEDLLRSGSRIIWQDHVERLIKQEGVYWLVALDREFVFDLATRNGVLYLIRNYNSNDENIVHIDLNQLPKFPCIIQVAWDCDFIELIVSVPKEKYSMKMDDYKCTKKTIGSNTPIELIRGADRLYNSQTSNYNTTEDFRRRLLEILKSIQRKIDTYSSLNEFWNQIESNKEAIKFTPKEKKDILSSLINLMTDELNFAKIHFTPKEVITSTVMKGIFSAKVGKTGNSKIVFGLTYAHSKDLVNELSNNFPSFMKSERAKYGVFLVPWFKCERFDDKIYDTFESMEFDLNKSLSRTYLNNPDLKHSITPIALDLTPDLKHSNRHHMANNSNLTFTQTGKELYATYQNRKINFSNIIMIGKRNTLLSDYQHLMLAKDNLRSYCENKKIPYKSPKNLTLIYSKDFKNEYSEFYKYIKPETFENFISKGHWQLGTIEYYRTIEDKKIRDEFEGFSFLNININNHMVAITFITGYNYLILCGTKSSDSKYHKENFGEKIICIPDIKSFAEIICKKVHAKRYFVQSVEYNSSKYYIVKNKIHDPYIDLRNLFTPPFFDKIFEHTFYPSLFVKPDYFKQENEVRIVFELDRDCFEPYKFEDKSLINFIQY